MVEPDRALERLRAAIGHVALEGHDVDPKGLRIQRDAVPPLEQRL